MKTTVGFGKLKDNNEKEEVLQKMIKKEGLRKDLKL
jgi:hypothetical protein